MINVFIITHAKSKEQIKNINAGEEAYKLKYPVSAATSAQSIIEQAELYMKDPFDKNLIEKTKIYLNSESDAQKSRIKTLSEKLGKLKSSSAETVMPKSYEELVKNQKFISINSFLDVAALYSRFYERRVPRLTGEER